MTGKVSAARLREARTYLGFSPDDVATAVEIERARFDDIEAGRQAITGEELRKLSRLYRRPVAWLCGETTFQLSWDQLWGQYPQDRGSSRRYESLVLPARIYSYVSL